MEVTRHSLVERQLSLIQHYLQRLDDLNEMYSHGHDWAQEALRSFDQDWQQLQTQQQWAVRMALHDKRAAHCVVSFPEHARILLMQADRRAALKWFEDALVLVKAEDFKTRYQLLRTSYDIHSLGLEVEQMRRILDDMDALARCMEDKGRLVTVALLNARYYEMQEDNTNQLIWSEHALTLAYEVEDTVLMADSQYQLGLACTRVYQYSRAKDCLVQALAIYQELGLRLKEAGALVAIGINAYYECDYESAVLYGEQALAIDRELGDRPRELSSLSNLAMFTLGIGDLPKALAYGRQAWVANRESGYQQSAFTALVAILMSLLGLGLADELHVYIGHARAFLRDYPSDYLESFVAYVVAENAYEHEQWHTACHLAGETAASDQRREDTEREYEVTLIWASSLLVLGELDAAALAFSRGLELYALEPENPLGWSAAMAGLSLVEAQRGNTDKAEQLLDRFVQLLQQDEMFKVFAASKAAWYAYCAAKLLNNPHIDFIHHESRKYLQKALSYLTDDVMRESFLSQYTIRQLMVACFPADPNTPQAI